MCVKSLADLTKKIETYLMTIRSNATLDWKKT